MQYKVIISKEAKNDIKNISEYLSDYETARDKIIAKIITTCLAGSKFSFSNKTQLECLHFRIVVYNCHMTNFAFTWRDFSFFAFTNRGN